MNIIVFGRVQGVGYRASALNQALSLGINGWVRNRLDGSVEILAEGDKLSIAALIDWCKRGPRWASVDEVKVVDETPKGEFAGFTIRRDG